MQAGGQGRPCPQAPTTAKPCKRFLFPSSCPSLPPRLLAQGGAGHGGCRSVLLPLHPERQDFGHVSQSWIACLQYCTEVACSCRALPH
jgi:hypothetical protein